MWKLLPSIRRSRPINEMKVTDQKRRLLESYLQGKGEPFDFEVIPRRRASETAPLSFAQQQIWLHAQLAPDTPAYNEPFTIHRTGPISIPVLERSLEEIVRRHEAWRTSFVVTNGEPVQKIHEPFAVKMPVNDLRNLPKEQRNTEAVRLATRDAREPFDLGSCPLFRARLLQLDDEEFRLAITAHHMIFDGVTGYHVFLPELVEIYNALDSRRMPELPRLQFQYGDVAAWQRSVVMDDKWADGLEYWREQLKGELPNLQLPADRPRPAVKSFRGATHGFSLSAELSEALRELARRQGVTLFMVLLAAVDVLLYRYSGLEDTMIGTITAGRKAAGTEKLMGFFLNTIALRTDLSGQPTFGELLVRARDVTLGAMSHDYVPINEVVRHIQPTRDLSVNPLFQVLLALEPSICQVDPGWNLTAIDVDTGTAKFDLCMVLDDRPEGLQGRLIYSTDLFESQTIVRMVGHWETLLESAVANPNASIARLSIMRDDELHEVLRHSRGARVEYPEAPITALISAATTQNPGAIALKCGAHSITYGELDQRANQLAHYLYKGGVRKEEPVAVYCERSIELIIGILAVLKAGGAYVPLDASHPKIRLEKVLSDSGAKFLLTQAHLTPLERPGAELKTVHLDTDWTEISSEPTSLLDVPLDPGDLAYIIYTSGTTGKPKGVMVEHRSLSASTQARIGFYGKVTGSYLLLSPVSFDSSVAVIFHTLSGGGTLILPDAEFSWKASELASIIEKERVASLLCVPAVYGDLLTVEDGTDRLRPLRTVIVAGDVCSRKLVKAHYKLLPNASLFNEYGPTEATVWSTVYACEAASGASSVPIGIPIANTSCYVLDSSGSLVPFGVPGELCIGGAGLARGYRHDSELTGEKFVFATFEEDKIERIYKTGDLVRWLPDGNLEFIGRVDQQVKIRGLRIEIPEIEASISEHPDVRETAVTVRQNAGGSSELTAYVAIIGEYSTSSAELRAFVKSRLPAYMVPGRFIVVSSLPRSTNGKLDRRALAHLDEAPVRAEIITGSVPRDFVDARLLAIWKEVIGRDDIDVRNDFFELGGHSLLAARLLAKIEADFGQSLSLAFVFQAPTVELMADLLRSPDHSLRARAIVPIQPCGSRPPLFWVRGGPRLRLLADKLGSDQPLLGLDLPFSDAAKLQAPYRLEDIAAFLLRAMREVQPHGPYFLAGLCVNAVIAYEIARQMSEAGEEIGLLAMLDGHNHAYYKHPFRDGRYSGRLKYHLSNLLRSDVRERSAYLLERFDEARRKVERMVWQLSSTSPVNGNGERAHNTDSVVHPAFHRYEPQPYSGKIMLLQSSDWPEGPYFDFRLGWQDLAKGGVEFHRIPGDHPSMFTEPNINVVADRLNSALSRPGSIKSSALPEHGAEPEYSRTT